MRYEIREKLKRVAELYPPERLEKSKERWRRVWAGEAPLDHYPFLLCGAKVNYYDAVNTKEDRLDLFLDEFILRGQLADDFIPTLFPGCRQSTMPGLLGAPEIVCQGDYTCEKIISCPEDVFRLPEPHILPGTPAWDWLEMEKFFLEESQGAFPIHVCDMQGPFDAAAQLWGYEELFPSAYEDWDAYDHLIRLMMRAFYLLWEEQKAVCGDLFVPSHLFGWSWVPENGSKATLSADSLAMISEGFFQAYYEPYLREMGQQLGTLSVHSCGNFSQVMKCLAAIPEVQAVNAGQMSPQQVYDAGWNGDKMMIISGVDYQTLPSLAAYLRNNRLRAEFRVYGLRDPEGNAIGFPKDTWDRNLLQKMTDCTKRITELLDGDLWK